MLRLKSEIWVHAFLRRCFGEGLFGAVARKGAAEAGAIYLLIDKRDGRVLLYGAPPGSAHDEEGTRRWELVRERALSAEEAQRIIDGLVRFDPDIWVVEIEDPRDQFDIAAL